MTELDKKLQKMALDDWEQFVSIIGSDAIVAAKICVLRKSDKSYEQIAMKLAITYDQARYGCNKCEIKG